MSERPDFDAENGGFLDVEETEEEMEVELNDEEPAFLAGQTQFSRCVFEFCWDVGVGYVCLFLSGLTDSRLSIISPSPTNQGAVAAAHREEPGRVAEPRGHDAVAAGQGAPRAPPGPGLLPHRPDPQGTYEERGLG